MALDITDGILSDLVRDTRFRLESVTCKYRQGCSVFARTRKRRTKQENVAKLTLRISFFDRFRYFF